MMRTPCHVIMKFCKKHHRQVISCAQLGMSLCCTGGGNNAAQYGCTSVTTAGVAHEWCAAIQNSQHATWKWSPNHCVGVASCAWGGMGPCLHHSLYVWHMCYWLVVFVSSTCSPIYIMCTSGRGVCTMHGPTRCTIQWHCMQHMMCSQMHPCTSNTTHQQLMSWIQSIWHNHDTAHAWHPAVIEFMLCSTPPHPTQSLNQCCPTPVPHHISVPICRCPYIYIYIYICVYIYIYVCICIVDVGHIWLQHTCHTPGFHYVVLLCDVDASQNRSCHHWKHTSHVYGTGLNQ